MQVWAFFFFFYTGHLLSANTGENSILVRGHAVFDIHPQTMSNTIGPTVHQTQRCCLQVDQLTTGGFSFQTLRGFLSACPQTEDSSATSCLRRTLGVKESEEDRGGHSKWGSAQLPYLNWCHPAIVGVLMRSSREKSRCAAEQLEKEVRVTWR